MPIQVEVLLWFLWGQAGEFLLVSSIFVKAIACAVTLMVMVRCRFAPLMLMVTGWSRAGKTQAVRDLKAQMVLALPVLRPLGARLLQLCWLARLLLLLACW